MNATNSTSDCAVCYVADERFLFPSVASALSFRRFVPEDAADVLLFLTGKSEADADVPPLRDALAHLGIKLLLLGSEQLEQVDAANWSHGHVSVTALGRFLIADTLASAYRRMLYVDGDTCFNADPTDLLTHDLAEGTIGAVDDIRAFARNDVGGFARDSRAYFADLGLRPDQRYFNSGVLLVGTATWQGMARESLRFFLDNMTLCKRHDQSAMNAVLADRRVALPIRWNFQTDYENLRLASDVHPAIFHFTGTSKPWFGPLTPWERIFPFYQEVEQRIAHIASRPAWPDTRVAAQNVVTRRLATRMHLMFAPRVFMKRRAILRADRAAQRAFEGR